MGVGGHTPSYSVTVKSLARVAAGGYDDEIKTILNDSTDGREDLADVLTAL